MNLVERITNALKEVEKELDSHGFDFDIEYPSSIDEGIKGMIEDGYSESDAKEWSENYCFFSIHIYEDLYDDYDNEYVNIEFNFGKLEKDIKNLILEKADITEDYFLGGFNLDCEVEVKTPGLDFDKYVMVLTEED